MILPMHFYSHDPALSATINHEKTVKVIVLSFQSTVNILKASVVCLCWQLCVVLDSVVAIKCSLELSQVCLLFSRFVIPNRVYGCAVLMSSNCVHSPRISGTRGWPLSVDLDIQSHSMTATGRVSYLWLRGVWQRDTVATQGSWDFSLLMAL